MANDNYEEAIQALKKLLIEKEEYGPVVAARIGEITAQLQTASADSSKISDPVERIKAGFIHFKKEKYE
nr:carbonic anhydrase 2-like [Ipomoea trifida]GMC59365.1 carbonic anhydrase 2 [Ipomoea batatas]